MRTVSFIYFVLVLLSMINCTKQQEIVVTELESGIPVYFDYDGDKEILWRLNIPQRIQIENTKTYDIFLESIQQVRDLSSARIFESKNGQLQDTHFKRNLIKKGDLKTFIVISNYHLTNNYLVNQDALKELFFNKKFEINNDSISVGHLKDLTLDQLNLIKEIVNKDSLDFLFLRDKSNPGFEKPIKIPVAF